MATSTRKVLKPDMPRLGTQTNSAATIQVSSDSSPDNGNGALSGYILDIFKDFKTSRLPFEEIWRECTFNFLGKYQQETTWKKKEGEGKRSRIFIKLTTLKVNTAHSRIIDASMSGRKNIPFDCEPVQVEENGINPDDALKMAKQFKKKLQDHFKYIELPERMNLAVHEMCMLGTAVMKGPIIDAKKVPQVQQRVVAGMPLRDVDPSANPFKITTKIEMTPIIDHIPLWEYYVDANAKSNRGSIGEIHFQRLLPSQFKRLALAGGYDSAKVKEAARRVSVNDKDDHRWEMMADNYMGDQGKKDEKVPVLEYWGLVPVQMLVEAGVELPDDPDLTEEDSIEALVVLAADGIVIKATLNPLGFRPFYVAPYKKVPHQVYGVGVAELMRDSQKMINSAARLYVDNKALSGNGILGINIDRIDLKRTGPIELYTGKTIYVKGNFAPRDALDLLTLPDITNGIREMIELFERFADEETGIPKYTSGDQGSFLNKTATGISMLMTASNVNLKSVMQNIDDYFIEPIVEGFYQWFMEMDGDQSMKLPLKIKASGTDSLMAKELQIENLMKFMQLTSAPQDAVFTDRPKLIQLIAELLETENILLPEEKIKEIIETAAKMADKPKDVREMVRLDALFQFMFGSEQAQILSELGVQPDPKRMGMTPQIAAGGVIPGGGPPPPADGMALPAAA